MYIYIYTYIHIYSTLATKSAATSIAMGKAQPERSWHFCLAQGEPLVYYYNY